ncbi:MAG: putative lipid II flippase FtsW [Propionibacteriaceae bacterium]|jgi:cell division protein FtsW|nr:putative lipid II flippase FtsW [Propionibacteriaceae bacterium]
MSVIGMERPGASSGAKQRALLSEWWSHPLASYYLVLASVVMLSAFGLIAVASASSVWSHFDDGNSWSYTVRHLAFMGGGTVLVLVMSRTNEVFLRRIAWVGFFLAALLLMLVFVPGIGREYYGNQSWVDIGFTQFQPSEPTKIALVLWSATMFAQWQRRLDDLRWLWVFLPGSGLLVALVAAERDLGTSCVLVAIMLAMLWFVGAPLLKVILPICSAALAGFVALVAIAPERMSRFAVFFADLPVVGRLFDGVAASTSDQPLNSVYGLASGGWWGLGIGASRQKWGGLYNGAQTDYIFSVLGEEHGLFGSLLVIGVFGVLIMAGIRISTRSATMFYKMTAIGVTAWFGVQAVVNIFVALNLMPVVGLPLPFLSYGGSALLAEAMAVGVLLACARHEPQAITALRAKRVAAPVVTGVVAAPRAR